MNRHHNVHRTAGAVKTANAGFKSLDELRTLILIAGEWHANLGIPRPTQPLREQPAQDLGSEP